MMSLAFVLCYTAFAKLVGVEISRVSAISTFCGCVWVMAARLCGLDVMAGVRQLMLVCGGVVVMTASVYLVHAIGLL